ncbi:MAG: hypothetical protein J5636_02450 [Clostridiales bacterium]|nr:hypothetical protein [Clostridiales bacterium]
MIKELKVNFFRILRSKAFIVIAILLVLGAVISALEIKFFVEDPFGFMDILRESVEETATSEEDIESFDVVFKSIEAFKAVNSLNGVVRMVMCSDLSCFLFCILAAMFISSEYKSRFHVNHFSLNTSPTFIVFMEWLSMVIVVVLMEILSYGITLGLSVLFCDTFRFDDGVSMLKNASLALGVTIVFTSCSFMIAYLRKAGALAIVLSSIFVFGVFDFVLGIISVWADWVGRFAPNNLLSMISLNQVTKTDYVLGMGVVVLYVLIFLSVSIIVAGRRDPY